MVFYKSNIEMCEFSVYFGPSAVIAGTAILGGQLIWALCLSGNPPLCFVIVIVQYCIFLYHGE